MSSPRPRPWLPVLAGAALLALLQQQLLLRQPPRLQQLRQAPASSGPAALQLQFSRPMTAASLQRASRLKPALEHRWLGQGSSLLLTLQDGQRIQTPLSLWLAGRDPRGLALAPSRWLWDPRPRVVAVVQVRGGEQLQLRDHDGRWRPISPIWRAIPVMLPLGDGSGVAAASQRADGRLELWRIPIRQRGLTAQAPTGPGPTAPGATDPAATGLRPGGTGLTAADLGARQPDDSQPAGQRPSGAQPTGPQPTGANTTGAKSADAHRPRANRPGAPPTGAPPIAADLTVGRPVALLKDPVAFAHFSSNRRGDLLVQSGGLAANDSSTVLFTTDGRPKTLRTQAAGPIRLAPEGGALLVPEPDSLSLETLPPELGGSERGTRQTLPGSLDLSSFCPQSGRALLVRHWPDYRRSLELVEPGQAPRQLWLGQGALLASACSGGGQRAWALVLDGMDRPRLSVVMVSGDGRTLARRDLQDWEAEPGAGLFWDPSSGRLLTVLRPQPMGRAGPRDARAVLIDSQSLRVEPLGPGVSQAQWLPRG